MLTRSRPGYTRLVDLEGQLRCPEMRGEGPGVARGVTAAAGLNIGVCRDPQGPFS